MTLPLMPGSEPVEIKYAVPEPIPTFSSSNVLEGCGCASCQREARREAMVAQYGGTVTGRQVSWNPQIQELPHPSRAQGIDPSWIQGRYDFSGHANTPNSSLHGAVRWLNPQTGECFDSTGSRQWTFDRLQDGWGSRDGVRFRPDTEPASIAPRPVFLWEDVSPTFDVQRLVSVPERSGPNVNRLRGRYDTEQGGGGIFRGQARWLDPADGGLYGSEGERNNTAEFKDGQWRTGGGLVWLPD